MRIALALLLVLAAAPGASAGDAADPYPLTTCIVSGKALDPAAEAVALEHEGREIRFCCTDCLGMFKADTAGYLEKLDAAIVEDQLPFYPVENCPVSGEKLGGMGEPDDVVVGNRLVRLCCSGCRKELAAKSEEFLGELDAAVIAAQAENYPLETCVNSGEKLGSMGDPYDMVVGGRLLRLCCSRCVEGVKKNPTAALAKLTAASAAE